MLCIINVCSLIWSGLQQIMTNVECSSTSTTKELYRNVVQYYVPALVWLAVLCWLSIRNVVDVQVILVITIYQPPLFQSIYHYCVMEATNLKRPPAASVSILWKRKLGDILAISCWKTPWLGCTSNSNMMLCRIKLSCNIVLCNVVYILSTAMDWHDKSMDGIECTRKIHESKIGRTEIVWWGIIHKEKQSYIVLPMKVNPKHLLQKMERENSF